MNVLGSDSSPRNTIEQPVANPSSLLQSGNLLITDLSKILFTKDLTPEEVIENRHYWQRIRQNICLDFTTGNEFFGAINECIVTLLFLRFLKSKIKMAMLANEELPSTINLILSKMTTLLTGCFKFMFIQNAVDINYNNLENHKKADYLKTSKVSLQEFFRKQLRRMKVNDEILLPMGWNGVSFPGHHLLCRIRKVGNDVYKSHLINTEPVKKHRPSKLYIEKSRIVTWSQSASVDYYHRNEQEVINFYLKGFDLKIRDFYEKFSYHLSKMMESSPHLSLLKTSYAVDQIYSHKDEKGDRPFFVSKLRLPLKSQLNCAVDSLNLLMKDIVLSSNDLNKTHSPTDKATIRFVRLVRERTQKMKLCNQLFDEFRKFVADLAVKNNFITQILEK